MKQRVTNQSV